MKRGLTLVEVLVATVLAGILALTVGIALTAGARLSREAETKTQLRRDGRVALLFVERRVRPQSHDGVQVNEAGDQLTLDPASPHPRYFKKEGSDLVYFDGATTVKVVPGTVSGLHFAIVNGQQADTYLVNVTLELSKSIADLQMTSMIRLRN